MIPDVPKPLYAESHAFLSFKYLAVINKDGRPYINIDTTTEGGILRADSLGFQIQPQIANVVITPLILEATQHLFSSLNKGMMFALLRHPVERAISQFYYLQNATWGE